MMRTDYAGDTIADLRAFEAANAEWVAWSREYWARYAADVTRENRYHAGERTLHLIFDESEEVSYHEDAAESLSDSITNE